MRNIFLKLDWTNRRFRSVVIGIFSIAIALSMVILYVTIEESHIVIQFYQEIESLEIMILVYATFAMCNIMGDGKIWLIKVDFLGRIKSE